MLDLKAMNTQDAGTQHERIGSCPVCGSCSSRYWTQAPDRFHGRRKQYRLVRCDACSLVWLNDPPSLEDMSGHYGPDYDRFISGAGESSPERWRKRKRTLTQYCPNGGALLDLGCSSGSFLESMRGPNWELCGIEISPQAAARAAARSDAQIFIGDVLSAPFQPETFDVITCFDVLEHLSEPGEIMLAIAKWLKPGGILYILVPNIDSAEFTIFGSFSYGLELPRHLLHFSPQSLRYLARAAGLREVDLTTNRNVAIEYSFRYVCDSVLHRFGISRKPLCTAGRPAFLWKVLRKIVRLTVITPLIFMMKLIGGGESIHAIFVKENESTAEQNYELLESR